MDPVSGIFAGLSLSIPLIQTVNDARAFLKEMRSSPDELAKLMESLDQLELILTGITGFTHRQRELLHSPNALDLVQRALQRCQSRVNGLEVFIRRLQSSLEHQRGVRKFWASIHTAVKKHEIKILRKDIHESIANLQMAVSVNVAQLQYLVEAHSFDEADA